MKKKFKILFNISLLLNIVLFIYLLIEYNTNLNFVSEVGTYWSTWIWLFSIAVSIVSKRALNAIKDSE